MCVFKMLKNITVYTTNLLDAITLGGAYDGDGASSLFISCIQSNVT